MRVFRGLIGRFVMTSEGKIARVKNIKGKKCEIEYVWNKYGKKVGKDGWVNTQYLIREASIEEALFQTLRE